MTYPQSIMILSKGSDSHGVKRCLFDMAAGLQRRGIAVNFLLDSDQGPFAEGLKVGPWPYEVASNARLSDVSGGGLRKAISMMSRGVDQMRMAGALADAVKRKGSDAILLCGPLDTLAASIAARRAGCTAYWMMPNEVSDYPLDFNRRVYRALFRHGSLVPLANSHFTDATLGPGAYPRRVCHLGIDPGEFDLTSAPRLSRSQLGIPDDAIVVGVLARMVENKGQLQMMRAIAALGEPARDVHLLLCGGPSNTSYTEQIDREARESGMTARVHNFGEQSDVLAYYQLCDIVANSRLDAEPFGLSVVEAMMLAKPVLAHRAGGPSETIVDGETGWHIQSPSLADFTTGLGRALADRARWPEIGAAARQRALDNFTVDHMVDRVLAAMRDLRR